MEDQGLFVHDVKLIGLWLFGAVAFILAIYAATNVWRDYQHQKMLDEKGCKVVFEYETGRQNACGRHCTKPEVVTEYQCRKRSRIEVN